MSEAIQVAVVISVAPTMASLGAVVIAWFGYRRSKSNATQISEVHLLINNRMDELLKAARSESHAEGMAEGRQAGIDERKERVVESERVEDRVEAKGTQPKRN